MRSSLSRRLLQLALLPALVFALIMVAYFALTTIERANLNFQAQVDTLTTSTLPAMESGLLYFDEEYLRRTSQVLLNAPFVRAAKVLDAAGNPIVEQGAQLSLPLLSGPPGEVHRLIQDTWIRVEIPIRATVLRHQLPEGYPDLLGWLVVDYSINDVQLENYRLITLGAVVAVAGLVLIWLLALRLIRPIVQPFHQTIDTLRAIKDGHYSERVALETSGELRRLGEGVNAMADSLQHAQRDMQQSVDQATQDLHQTLEALEIQNIQLGNARRQAQEASEAKTQFLANMSHEIRTPLNGVLGFARLLAKTDLDTRQKDYLQTIQRSSESLLTIINDILDFLKLESGKLELEQRPMHLRDVIEDVMDLLGPLAQDKDLELVTLVYEDVPLRAFGDPLRLRQVLTNLVGNAIKFTTAGHVAVRLMLEQATEQTMHLRFSVSDTGPGMSREQQNRLFSAFSQADASTSRRFGGTGLGLVICQRLIEQMHGHIGVESVQGEGSTFWFTLDLDIDHQAIAAQPADTLLAGSHVLVLEPHELSRTVLGHRLEQWGMVVHDLTVLSDEQALSASEQRPRLAILTCDAQHPDRLRRAVQQCQRHGIPIVLLTRHNEIRAELNDIAPLVDVHSAKPIRYSRLYAICTELLGRALPELNTETPPTNNQPRILVVDDNATNRKLLTALLGDYGITPSEAEDGAQAMACVSQQSFDLVFMDIQMPVMDGITATKEIRRHERPDEHLPVIALTAHALPEEEERLRHSGFDDYITKPIDEAQLLNAVFQWTGIELVPLTAPPTLDAGSAAGSAPSKSVSTATDKTVRAVKSPDEAGPVDIPLALQRAGNKPDLARDMFQGLLEQIQADRTELAQLHADKARSALLERVHALHGLTRYCGVPVLEQAVRELEVNLKNTQCSEVPAALNRVLEAMAEVEWWSTHRDWQPFFASS